MAILKTKTIMLRQEFGINIKTKRLAKHVHINSHMNYAKSGHWN